VLPEITTLLADIERYQARRDASLYVQISQNLIRLSAVESDEPGREESVRDLEQLMLHSAKIEPIWGFMAGMLRWRAGCRSSHDFSNIWNCARYTGIQSRYANISPETYLAYSGALFGPEALPGNPLPYLIRGNALRQLRRYAEADSSYLEGIETCPGDPFLKFRLVDLCLMTYRIEQARQLLASLRNQYPYALEMMFILPVPPDSPGPQNVLPALSAGQCEFVWVVAADPVYVERYAVRFATHVREQTAGKAHLHCHVIRDPDTPAPAMVIETLQRLLPLCSTERMVPLAKASANQRKALFASERFFFVAELLEKYRKPLIVSDIDIDCLRNPFPLFDQLDGADIGLTRFGEIRDAWDRYPATAIVVRPTEAAIEFFRRLSAMIIALLTVHPQPWFVDQIALYRLIEEGLTSAKHAYLDSILTDADSPSAYFRILHGSWQA